MGFASASARAFCREVTETPPPGLDPSISGVCFTTDPEGGGPLPVLFWRNQCVSFNVNRAASPRSSIGLSDAELVANTAFSKWWSVTCPGGGAPSILATEGPAVDCAGQAEGHNNPIVFRDSNWPYTDATSTLGYTTLTVRLDTGEILGAEIEINSGQHTIVLTSPPPNDQSYDLQSILTHEAGHFLGLAHSPDKTAVMYALYHAGSTTLQPDDISGICSIYSPDGARNTLDGELIASSCNPEPILGLEDLCGSLDAGALPPSGTPTSDAGVGPLTETLWGCAMGRTGTRGAAGFAGGLVILGILTRRRLRRASH
jgi:hypothetical protein